MSGSGRPRLRDLIAGLCLFYLSVSLPLAAMVYSPAWYRWNCQFHPRCEQIGEAATERGIAELTHFFRHDGALVTRWTEKERRHLAEVRGIYDVLFLGTWLALAGLLWGYRPVAMTRIALVNAGLILALLAVLPVFKPFWEYVFHPLLFNNLDWKNTRADLSYYLMPRRFFLHSTAVLIAAAAIGNLAVWALSRHLGRRDQVESPS